MSSKIFSRAISHAAMALVIMLTVSFLGLFTNTLNAQATFYLSGSVYHQQIVKGANDESIPMGDPQLWPFLKVTAYEKTSTTTALLGSSDTHPSTGGYNMLFTRPNTTPIPEVIIVVSEIVEGHEEVLHQQTLTNVSQFTYTKIVIEDTDPLLLGLPGVMPGIGLGVFFTRVGNVDRDTIVHTADPKLGLANLTPAQAKYTPQFKDAAFGGDLMIFGQFAEIIAGGASTIDYYQVRLQPVEVVGAVISPLGSPTILKDPLTNVRKRYNFFAGTYKSEWIELGPAPAPMQNSVTLANEEGLYKVVKPVASGGIYEYWTWPDLLAYWKSSKYPDGIYKITLRYFHEISATQVQELVPVANPADHIILRIENRLPTAEFVRIIKTGGVGGDVVVADFAAGTGLCDIIKLGAGERLKVTFKAHQAGGFMHSYHLLATPNQGASITFAQGSYPDAKVPAPAPGSPVWYWEGTPAGGMTSVPKTFTVQCGYIFGLTLTPRIQNGYHWIYDRYPHYAFYVIPH